MSSKHLPILEFRLLLACTEQHSFRRVIGDYALKRKITYDRWWRVFDTFMVVHWNSLRTDRCGIKRQWWWHYSKTASTILFDHSLLIFCNVRNTPGHLKWLIMFCYRSMDGQIRILNSKVYFGTIQLSTLDTLWVREVNTTCSQKCAIRMNHLTKCCIMSLYSLENAGE